MANACWVHPVEVRLGKQLSLGWRKVVFTGKDAPKIVSADEYLNACSKEIVSVILSEFHNYRSPLITITKVS